MILSQCLLSCLTASYLWTFSSILSRSFEYHTGELISASCHILYNRHRKVRYIFRNLESEITFCQIFFYLRRFFSCIGENSWHIQQFSWLEALRDSCFYSGGWHLLLSPGNKSRLPRRAETTKPCPIRGYSRRIFVAKAVLLASGLQVYSLPKRYF